MPGTMDSGAKSKPFKSAKGIDPWEIQPATDDHAEESDEAYEAFNCYRRTGVGRSQESVALELGKSETLMARWSVAWGWRSRARAWDKHLQSIERDEQEKAVKAAAKRHARTAALVHQVGSAELAKLAKRVADEKDAQVFVNRHGETEVGSILAFVEKAMRMERLVLGEPESVTETRQASDWVSLMQSALEDEDADEDDEDWDDDAPDSDT